VVPSRVELDRRGQSTSMPEFHEQTVNTPSGMAVAETKEARFRSHADGLHMPSKVFNSDSSILQ
jgi:hypothetical protein